ncbi:hypothetical protein [Rossellomorea sp. YZS02]|uniref:hypothetical protein n=1 Tax=Rossellomorea sp. YZS02 TaxID=3097358 RepID=UPI002A10AA97|nr:hypothetical protein [Rossellomorea sp. YZS02]MDX8344128.1 hypothetical protein [Rossellomorea sp. YZS02]
MTILLSEPDGPCTADASPKTFVIEVDHETEKKLDTIIIVEEDIQTSVPIEEPEAS